MNKTAALELKKVSKHFGSVIANHQVDLTVYQGEILSVLGENGSGKTTLMNMIAGIYYPDDGQIFVDGKEAVIRSPKDAFDYKIGMIHQHFKLVDVFTATENIVLGLREKTGFDLKKSAERVQEISEKYGQSASGLAFSSRIEYFMGRVYQYEENSKDAISHYEKGFEYAEDSLKLETSVLALLMKSECISQMCALKPVSYAMANGLKVGSLADEVLNIDSQNTAALYLKAARYIYAPKIFADQKKGRKMLLEGLETMPYFPPDDEFNFNLAMGYSYIQTKDKEEALEYLDKALEVYPSNKYCKTLIEEAGKLR